MLMSDPSGSGLGFAMIAMVWLNTKIPRLATFCRKPCGS
jgi:hypothetical protein